MVDIVPVNCVKEWVHHNILGILRSPTKAVGMRIITKTNISIITVDDVNWINNIKVAGLNTNNK